MHDDDLIMYMYVAQCLQDEHRRYITYKLDLCIADWVNWNMLDLCIADWVNSKL
jgi:hypothetical protein